MIGMWLKRGEPWTPYYTALSRVCGEMRLYLVPTRSNQGPGWASLLNLKSSRMQLDRYGEIVVFSPHGADSSDTWRDHSEHLNDDRYMERAVSINQSAVAEVNLFID